MLDNLKRNPVTTVMGFVVLVGMGLKILLPGHGDAIDALFGSIPNLIQTIVGFGSGVGLLFAKDGNVTRTAAAPPPKPLPPETLAAIQAAVQSTIDQLKKPGPPAG